MEQVTQQMNSYSLVTSQNNDFLMFSNKTETCHFSYKFINDSLYCALVIMPQLAENADLGNMLRGYSYIGELSNIAVYQNKGEDILACTYEYKEDDVKFQAFGFTPINSEMSAFASAGGITAGHEWVDLGLSVKWATCNVGAEFPEEYGSCYSWGETEEKEENNYSWSIYKWCNGNYTSMTKYCTDSRYGTVDNKTTLDLEDDIVHVKWGDTWRMPTLTEIEELCEKCSWLWTEVNGVKGQNVTGPNGNSIFLPGHKYLLLGSYWSSTLHESNSYKAYALHFAGRGAYGWGEDIRCTNFTTVRPVTE